MDHKTIGLIGIGFVAGAIAGSFALYFIKQGRKSDEQGKKQRTQVIEQPHNDMFDEHYWSMKNEQVARVIKYFGEQKFSRLESSFVVVFGVGGVGSHVVNMLVRSGVRRIRIVDFDTVSLSSLSRHSFALREDVGSLKVECMRKYIAKIFPHVLVECINVYATPKNIRLILFGKDQCQITNLINKSQFQLGSDTQIGNPDYVIDCIDNLDAKVELVVACLEKKLRLIVSGGAGMKSDPTKLQIRDVSDCKYDKLIMRLKRELSKRQIKTGFKVAFSYQQSEKQLLPLTETQQKDPASFKVFENYRIRIVPVLGTMPAILGMAIASYVLCDLAGEPYEAFETDYVKSSSLNKIYNQLLYQVKRRGLRADRFLVDIEEVSILAKKVFNWKCVVDPNKKGERLAIWDSNQTVNIGNLALMTKENYETHIKAKNLGDLNYPAEIIERFQAKSKEARQLLDGGYMMFI